VALTESELGDLLARFTRSAFRFEPRERYNSDVGREPFRRFLAGEPDDYEWHQGWMRRIRLDTEAGKVWQRVRIVSVPLSDYNRYALTVARLSVSAGEDIRYLERQAALRLGLAPLDAWLLDGARLARLDFDERDDRFIGAELIADPAVVDRHKAWRELALRHAQDIESFAAAHW
jgi:hypothetical protein